MLVAGSDKESASLFAECGFRPALSVVCQPTFFKQLPPGRGIGYDATYHTSGHEWIANLTTGWSDGLSRRLTNNGFVKRMKTGESTGRENFAPWPDSIPVCDKQGHTEMYGEVRESSWAVCWLLRICSWCCPPRPQIFPSLDLKSTNINHTAA